MMDLKASCFLTFVMHFQSTHLQNIASKCCLNILCILFIKLFMMIYLFGVLRRTFHDEFLKNISSITFISGAIL